MAPGGEELLSFPFGGAPGCHPPVSGLPPIEIFMPDLRRRSQTRSPVVALCSTRRCTTMPFHQRWWRCR